MSKVMDNRQPFKNKLAIYSQKQKKYFLLISSVFLDFQQLEFNQNLRKISNFYTCFK